MEEDQVYVIGTSDSSVAKIGVSNAPQRRLRQIQSMSPLRLQVLWACPGSYDLEAALHAHFNVYRSHGEWFDFRGLDPVKVVQDALPNVRNGVPVKPRKGVRAAPMTMTMDATLDCVCGHRPRLHGQGGCTVAGWDESRDCQCSAYTSASVLKDIGEITRVRKPRAVTKGWQGPTPPQRAAATEDARYASVHSQAAGMTWPGGGVMIHRYWAEHLATCILWRIHGAESPSEYPAVILDEIAQLAWPHGSAMVPGTFAERLTYRVLAALHDEHDGAEAHSDGAACGT